MDPDTTTPSGKRKFAEQEGDHPTIEPFGPKPDTDSQPTTPKRVNHVTMPNPILVQTPDATGDGVVHILPSITYASPDYHPLRTPKATSSFCANGKETAPEAMDHD
ncbi:hypothetical protein BZG36_01809 [Bifiguratus adelaidae]|uniref:Uncharacterized protein n=1 Tax=Bifiguratus adelaidae TaxID=1938954 RepID=A0A261Y2K5_9FUNG|nr:hypothetical protein BZG36_01809 [Bifiguratus adelaidae]